MSFKIKPSRTYELPYSNEEEGISFSLTFRFPITEDLNVNEIKRKLETVNSDVTSLEVIYGIIRRSIIDSKDIIDEDTGEEFKVKNEDGSVNEQNQKIMFDAIRFLPDYFKRVLTSYIGPSSKN